MSMLTTLSRLLPGQEAEVVELPDLGEESQRLADLGVDAGARVRMLVKGSPFALQVGGCRLMLRGSHFDAIPVRVEAS